MEENIQKIIKEYEINKNNIKEYNSYINHVRQYDRYIFKEVVDLEKFENETKWLKKLMEFEFSSPKLITSYDNRTIVMEKIDGKSIKDSEAKEHLYNIGKLIASLHNIPAEHNKYWDKKIYSLYGDLKDEVKNIMNKDIFEKSTKFLSKGISELKNCKTAIIHRDVRPENVMYSNGKYYLIDLESLCIGDVEYDFTRMFSLLNEKDMYTYEDFKNFIDGYRSINEIEVSTEKWQLYNKVYSFRIYSKMLLGKINRDEKYEKYLENCLVSDDDKITNWIKKYNNN